MVVHDHSSSDGVKGKWWSMMSAYVAEHDEYIDELVYVAQTLNGKNLEET